MPKFATSAQISSLSFQIRNNKKNIHKPQTIYKYITMCTTNFIIYRLSVRDRFEYEIAKIHTTIASLNLLLLRIDAHVY